MDNQNWLFLVPGDGKTIFIQNKRGITKSKNRRYAGEQKSLP